MEKKIIRLLMIGFSVFMLAACSVLPQTGSTQPANASSASQQAQSVNPAQQPVEEKLALGTLKLEGTDMQVTVEQAKDLLPLWKAVRSLSSSETISSEEIAALYKQIQEAMTPEQMQAIEAIDFSQVDIRALMEQYGAEVPQGGPAGMSEEEFSARATQRAENGDTRQMPSGSEFQGGGGAFPGGDAVPGSGREFPGGGMPPGEGGFQGRGTNTNPGSADIQGTPSAGMGGRRFGGGMNLMLVEPLIKLLEERAGS